MVDDQNNPTGVTDVLSAHAGAGRLHRAVSVVVYRNGKSGPELLLQKRGGQKALWPHYWTNTVCTHPQPDESGTICAVRRLREEMGISADADDLRFVFFLRYQASYTAEAGEHELDGVYILNWNGNPIPNPREAAGYRWQPLMDILRDMKTDPDVFTPWFRLMLIRDSLVLAIRNGGV